MNYSSFHSLDSYLGLKMAELKMAEVDSFPEVAASEESMSHMSRCAGVGGGASFEDAKLGCRCSERPKRAQHTLEANLNTMKLSAGLHLRSQR